MSLIRSDLASIPAYQPGRTPADVARDHGLDRAIKLASNETPFGPLPGVVDAIAAAAADINRYPDLFARELRQQIAERYAVDPARVITGCGSVALAEQLALVAATPNDQLLYAWRSFEAYPIIVNRIGAGHVRVPNTPGHEHDLDAMVAAITPQTRLIFICSPNNPTSTAVGGTALERFLDQVPADVLVVLDEAYREFVTDPAAANGTDFLDRPNVVVLRTFSKAWGLAGTRIGYLIGSVEVASAVAKVLTPFSSSVPAQAAALAALQQVSEVHRRCAIIAAERERVAKSLRTMGVDVPDSQGNFVWLPLGESAASFGTACETRGVIVRPFAGDGVRVTIGTPEENDAFLAVATEVLRN